MGRIPCMQRIKSEKKLETNNEREKADEMKFHQATVDSRRQTNGGFHHEIFGACKG